MPWPWNERTVLIEAEEAILLPDVASEALALPPPRQAGAGAGYAAGGAARARPAWRNRVHVLLGYPWAHSQLLPWQDGLAGRQAQWRAYALGLMRERGIGGELALRLTPPRHAAAAGLRRRRRLAW